VVLLDLRRGKYVGIGNNDLEDLRRVVSDWQMDSAGLREAEPSDRAIASAEHLVALELLTRDVNQVRTCAQSNVVPAREVAFNDATKRLPRIRLHHVIRFAGSFLFAIRRLKRQSLDNTIAHLTSLKAHCMAGDPILDLQSVRELVGVYQYIRPFVFTAKDKCLLDSLVLMRFLLGYRVPATLIIGARTQPFAAHSWVQHEAMALNETVEKTRAYAPIVSV
jgi:hypothetical protein